MKKKMIIYILLVFVVRILEFFLLKGNVSCDSPMDCAAVIIFTYPSYISFIFLIVTAILMIRSISYNNYLIDHSSQSDQVTLNNYIEGEEYNKFIADRFEDYKKIQQDWMNFNYDGLRENLTDELYNQYEMQLDTLKTKNQKNIITDIHPLGYKIQDIKEENGQIQISMMISVSMVDYIEQNGKIIRGKNKPARVKYILDFVSNKTNNDKCPNCGASLTNNASQICSHCNSVISKTHSKYVLAKKINILQDGG